LLKPRAKTVVIDVRNPQELNLQGGYIRAENFYNIPRGQLELEIATHVPGKDTPIVVYDDFNQRSPLAADALMKLGYSNVKIMQTVSTSGSRQACRLNILTWRLIPFCTASR